MRDDEKIRDRRSTGRKRGRTVLKKLTLEGEREYICNECGHIPSVPLEESSRGGDILDCNHKNKNWMDCDPSNLEWLCRKCHYAKDRSTAKGVSSIEDEFGYGDLGNY